MTAAKAHQQKCRVVLGLLTFGPPGSESYGSRVTSLQRFKEILDCFQDQGYNEVDTARTYVNGLQESFTNSADWQERNLSLATKCFPLSPGLHSRSSIKEKLETSLTELGCESVDIFYLHAPDRSVPFEETLEACNELYQAEKFKQLGLSNYAAWEVAEIWNIANERKWIKPTVYQAMYNAFTRAIEDELVPCCRKYGISIIGYNPLAGGMLTGKYKTSDLPTEGRYSNTDSNVGKMYRERYFRDANFDAIRLLEPVAKEEGLSLSEIAFRWYVHHSKLDMISGNDGVVIGVSSIDQLKANLTDLEKGPLPESIVTALESIWENVTRGTCSLYWR